MDKIRIVLFTLLLCLSCSLYAAGTVNINTADKDTLMTIKGVGEKRADAIIDYRKEHGPFASVDDLAHVEGIGQTTVDGNRDNLTVDK